MEILLLQEPLVRFVVIEAMIREYGFPVNTHSGTTLVKAFSAKMTLPG